jgi:hypothetical protein
MVDEAKVRESIRRMRTLIKIGRERLGRHSPVWAVYLAGETFQSLSDALDDLASETGGKRTARTAKRRVQRAV